MKEYSSNPKIQTLKLVSVLLMATFLQAGTACSEGGLGGDSGCGSGSTTEVRATLNANLQNLSNSQLLSLCAGVGCSTRSAANPLGSNPIGGGCLSGANRLGDMSRGEVVAYKKRCVNVLRSPQRYESDIVSLCRLVKRERI